MRRFFIGRESIELSLYKYINVPANPAQDTTGCFCVGLRFHRDRNEALLIFHFFIAILNGIVQDTTLKDKKYFSKRIKRIHQKADFRKI